MLLFYIVTQGIARRLNVLRRQSARMALGDYSTTLPEQGNDEITVFTRTLNTHERGAARAHRSWSVAAAPAGIGSALQDPVRHGAPAADRIRPRGPHHRSQPRRHGNLWPPRGRADRQALEEVRFWASAVERKRIWNMYQNDGAVHGDIAGVLLADGSVGSVAIWSSSLTLDGQDAIIWALLDLTEELNAKRELKDLNFSLELRRGTLGCTGAGQYGIAGHAGNPA
jgi:hypothetical protein